MAKFDWNNEQVSLTDFAQKAKSAANNFPPPEVSLRADRRVMYEIVAQVLSTSEKMGLTKIGFVTEAN
jgi:biopolymer transport protein ExbD